MEVSEDQGPDSGAGSPPGEGGGRERRMLASSDPRAVRTRQKLVDAFHAGIADGDLSSMSVSSLSRAAGINRTSFYSHFASPEDLAIHALSELFDVVGQHDIAARTAHSIPAAEASRQALRDIVGFVHERRDSYARVLGSAAAPRLVQGVTEAFTERTVESLARMPLLPPGADVAVTARFLAGGVLGVIGAWLSDGDGPSRSPEELVEALVQCLPGWLNND
jgi:AcrR family transcriptional regulator